MKKLILGLAILLTVQANNILSAKEGMWLPIFLEALNGNEMKSMGLKIPVDEIYSINKSSLKDAIVSFGGFCTGSVISPEGLVLTNHHCGNGAVQRLSSLENNYLVNGFWAKDKASELPAKGLHVTFIHSIKDVTNLVLADVSQKMTEKARAESIKKAIDSIVTKNERGSKFKAIVRPMFEGNEYYLFLTLRYDDIRLVATPPDAIGRFGGDEDNWMWPRHNADFSMFRIYADENNMPAKYSPDNKPFRAKRHLPISTKGVKEGDFTMVYGFPGRTFSYVTSNEIDFVQNTLNPERIALRQIRFDVMDREMRASEETFIKYNAKRASVSNAWKKWIGQQKGLKDYDVLEKKKAEEAEFQEWTKHPTRKARFSTTLADMERVYTNILPSRFALNIYQEAFTSIEMFRFALSLRGIEKYKKDMPAQDSDAIKGLQGRVARFYKDYIQAIDEEIAAKLIYRLVQDVDDSYLPREFRNKKNRDVKFFENYIAGLFKRSVFSNPEKVKAYFANPTRGSFTRIQRDPVYRLVSSVSHHFMNEVYPIYKEINKDLDSLERHYVQGIRVKDYRKKFAPDANSTLRVAYGVVDDYSPVDGMNYDFQTHLKGIVEKNKTGHPDYACPQRLLDLYKSKDYGKWGVKGKMPICFIASNHTTGGNSGSPVIDAYGRLIGLNFDRTWESTMSDYNFDARICRNIAVDIRYILFLVDKYAGATHLIKEMGL